jgi:predicted metal-dependent HD superfamily phosphohydrolase
VDELLTRWTALVGASPGAEAAGRDLLARWSQPHRHYHDVTHLRAVLDAVDAIADENRPQARADLDVVRLAAWFHDAVYDGAPGDDERASANLAATMLPPLGVDPARAAEVGRLVRLTIDHDPAPDDLSGAVLCDADLAVLGGSPEDYAAYAAAVRADYAHIDDETFRVGRVAVLEALLAADPLFRTQFGRARWEATARRNLGTELALLELR